MEQRRSEKLGRLGEALDVVESGLGVMPFIGMGEGEARGLGGCPSVVSGQHSNWLFCEWKGETERWPHISEEEGSKRAIWWHVRQAAERFRSGADGGGGVGFQK
jgi:hypothetical protein